LIKQNIKIWKKNIYTYGYNFDENLLSSIEDELRVISILESVWIIIGNILNARLTQSAIVNVFGSTQSI